MGVLQAHMRSILKERNIRIIYGSKNLLQLDLSQKNSEFGASHVMGEKQWHCITMENLKKKKKGKHKYSPSLNRPSSMRIREPS